MEACRGREVIRTLHDRPESRKMGCLIAGGDPGAAHDDVVASIETRGAEVDIERVNLQAQGNKHEFISQSSKEEEEEEEKEGKRSVEKRTNLEAWQTVGFVFGPFPNVTMNIVEAGTRRLEHVHRGG